MTIKKIAEQLVNYLEQGQFEKALRDLFAEEAVSIEPEKSNIPVFQGLQAILKKGEDFRNSVEVWHGLSVSAPLITKEYFAISFTVELTYKGQKEPTTLEELIIYQVKNGKIIQEQFIY